MQAMFFERFDDALRELHADEVLLANFEGERSDFVRFNHARVRQPGSVRQAYLSLTLTDGRRRCVSSLTLTGAADPDRDAIHHAIARMRDTLPSLPEDPYLLYSTAADRSETIRDGRLPSAAESIDTVVTAGAGSDLVGIFASGPIYRGFANSFGARHWHAVDAFQFDWSTFHAGDKAVKRAYAGSSWDAQVLATRIQQARAELVHLALPVKVVEPGEYRVYLAPAAVNELIGMLDWDGVSERAQRTKSSPLQRLVEGDAALATGIHLAERYDQGLAPLFDAAGFTRPPAIDLIRAGRHAGALISARSGKEYGIASNGADASESMQAPSLEGGLLAAADALTALGTGLYISNLWYLNFSDRPACRITGMTRFASFWVESGRIVAPLSVMRFDDSLYRMLGSNLESLTGETEWILDASTYDQRSVRTSRMPGALVAGIRFTL